MKLEKELNLKTFAPKDEATKDVSGKDLFELEILGRLFDMMILVYSVVYFKLEGVLGWILHRLLFKIRIMNLGVILEELYESTVEVNPVWVAVTTQFKPKAFKHFCVNKV